MNKINYIMMTRNTLSFIMASAFLLTGCQNTIKKTDFSAIEKSFINPTDKIQTSVYWYWINDNISKEAVVKDLHAMKQVGINRAFIGNIGLSPEESPYGKVKLFTDEWWEIMHTALKTATELNIEIGIFNSPGWSQSGGPWIKTEQSMRYIASSELRVKGPQKLVRKLEQPTTEFQDVKVLTWQVANGYKQNLLDNVKMIRFSSAGITINQSNNTELSLVQPETTVDIVLSEKAIARSLVIYPANRPIQANCELQAKDGNEYHTVKKFNINRSNAALNVGFEPYAPIAISLPETQAQEFRLIFSRANRNSGIDRIVLSPTPVVERYPEKSLAKMFQTPLPYWRDYLWDKQPEFTDASLIISPDKVQDISKYFSADGTLSWDVPEGEWIIMRTGMAPTGVVNSPASPEGTGKEVDKMNKQHVVAHFDSFIKKILERIPAADRKTWKVVVEDSYETGGQNFTDGFLEEFQQRYGYDPVPWLPVYKGHTIGSPDLSDRFLWDVRRLVADKVAYDYVGGLREVSNKHGLTTWLENYGHWGFPAEFLQYGGQSDEIGGEFWSEGNLGDIENRAASSCAHIYGKNKVSAESFTCAGDAYSRYPATMKRRGDWSFTEGINNTLLHVYIQQPYEEKAPGVNTWFGNEFNRLNTWFSHLDLFTTYLKRCNFMLQQGLNVADVAYFIGEDAPKMTGVRDPELPKGYNFDYINAEVIERSLSVKDGRLVLPHGTSYRILVLPKLETMRPEVLQKIEKLVAAGATVLGPPPSRSPSMQNFPDADKQVKSLAAKMWGDLSVTQRSYGKGQIFTGMTMEEVFERLKLKPDCLYDKNEPILYTHRKCGNSDIYFISNQSGRMIQTDVQFRVQGMQPELWDAVNGKIRPLPAFLHTEEATVVPLQLDANESAFIVFRKKGKSETFFIQDNYPNQEVFETVTSPWEVTFESDEIKRGPAQAVIFDKLHDWRESENEAIRYYSGTARYKTVFPVEIIPKGLTVSVQIGNLKMKNSPKQKTIFLELGKVHNMAKVKINGHYAGGVWTAPYRLDVTEWIKEGDNTLEVEVVNTWVNRLIGDQRLPEQERRAWAHNNPWKADSWLQASGLIGPVELRIEN